MATIPTGTVLIEIDGAGIGSFPLDGSGDASAQVQITDGYTPGIHNILAVYSGDGVYPQASGTASFNVDPNQPQATVTVSVTPNPVQQGASITISVSVMGNQ